MKLKLIIILLLASSLAMAQNTGRQYIGLSVGPSIPSGNFSKGSLTDSTSGWAKTGVAINITYAYRLTHNVGLYGLGAFISNKFDIFGYEDALQAAHPDTAFTVESARNWSGGGLVIGPYIRLPLSDNLSWDIRGAFGVYNAYSPRITIDNSTTGQKYIRESGSAFNYAYTFGSGFKYSLANYYVLLFADYFAIPLKFKNPSGWDWNNEPYTIEFTQHITYFAVTIGFGYYF